MSKYNIDDTILSQYSASPRIKSLLRGFNELIKPDADVDLFYNNVFNILTAQGYGLDVWGEIIGIGRTFNVRDDNTASLYLGFEGSEQDVFDSSPFYNTGTGAGTVTLSDNAYRELLLIKQAANISRTDACTITTLLERLYRNRGEFYALETGIMKLRYIFEFYLEPFEEVLIQRRELPPKPAGVTYQILQVKTSETFGFEGSEMQPFDQGVFSPFGLQDTIYINVGE